MESDLYSWREIFQLYLEAEIFESIGEQTRGERSVEESEKRLQLFVEWLSQHPRARKNFKMKQSANALATFLSLNMFILNVKKVCSFCIYSLLLLNNFFAIDSFRWEMLKLLVKFSRNMLNGLPFLYHCLPLLP